MQCCALNDCSAEPEPADCSNSLYARRTSECCVTTETQSYVSMSQHKEYSAQRASRPDHSRFMSDVGAPRHNAPHERICML